MTTHYAAYATAFVVLLIGAGGARATPVWVDDTNSAFIYSSPNAATSWKKGSDSQDTNGTEHFNNFAWHPVESVPVQGAMAVLNFNGTAAQLLGKKGPNFGIGAWAIDGGALHTFNAWASGVEHKQVLANVSGLSPGPHVLTYQVTGRTTGSNYYQVIDGANVTGQPMVASSRASFGQTQHTGAWMSGSNSTDLSGSHAWDGHAGDTISWNFTGSLVEMYGRPDVGDGLFDVLIDHTKVATLDGHYSEVDNDGLSGYMFFARRVSSGTHNITIRVDGVSDKYNGKEASGLRNLVQFDEWLAFNPTAALAASTLSAPADPPADPPANSPVNEPGTWLLLLPAAALLGIRLARRDQRQGGNI